LIKESWPSRALESPSVRAAHLIMASAMTGEFVKASKRTDAPFSMIERKGLLARLREEVALAAREIARDPRGFIRDLFADDSRDARRRRRIYIGLSCAVIGHVVLFAVMLVVGWPRMLTPSEEEAKLKIDHMISFAKANELPEPPQQDVPRGDNGGGGGGGQQNPLPPSVGAPPQMLSVPSEVKLTPPTVETPSLPIAPNIVGPDSPPPPPDVPLGVPNATSETPSGGPGKGGGLGTGNGPGVGEGGGPGSGTGSGGSTGTRTAGSPDGTNSLPTGPIDWSALRRFPDSTQFSWIYRPRPVVTPEAMKNKSVGEVLLRATFNSDGTITDIALIRSDVPEMIESAIQSLERSKFRPATIQGKPVTVRNVVVRVSVHY
jgi:TonB family protein